MSEETDDYADPGPPAVPLPPAQWVPFGIGLTLPHLVIVGGWKVARAVAPADPPGWWWDDAGSWVYRATALSMALGVWLGWPVLRRAREPYRMFLAVVTGVGYFGLLVVVNFFAYLWSGAPFP